MRPGGVEVNRGPLQGLEVIGWWVDGNGRIRIGRDLLDRSRRGGVFQWLEEKAKGIDDLSLIPQLSISRAQPGVTLHSQMAWGQA
jgi:hypothetical protein